MEPNLAYWVAVRLAGFCRLPFTPKGDPSLWFSCWFAQPDASSSSASSDPFVDGQPDHLRWTVAGAHKLPPACLRRSYIVEALAQHAGLWANYVDFVIDCTSRNASKDLRGIARRLRERRPQDSDVDDAERLIIQEGAWLAFTPWPRLGWSTDPAPRGTFTAIDRSEIAFCQLHTRTLFDQILLGADPGQAFDFQRAFSPLRLGPETGPKANPLRRVLIEDHNPGSPDEDDLIWRTLWVHVAALWNYLSGASPLPAIIHCRYCGNPGLQRNKRRQFCTKRCHDKDAYERRTPQRKQS